MNRLVVSIFVGFVIVVTGTTSASAFRCLARSSNGVSTWGYSLIFERARYFAVRHCHVAGGLHCHVALCR